MKFEYFTSNYIQIAIECIHGKHFSILTMRSIELYTFIHEVIEYKHKAEQILTQCSTRYSHVRNSTGSSLKIHIRVAQACVHIAWNKTNNNLALTALTSSIHLPKFFFFHKVSYTLEGRLSTQFIEPMKYVIATCPTSSLSLVLSLSVSVAISCKISRTNAVFVTWFN